MLRLTSHLAPDRERAHEARQEIGAWLLAHAVAVDTVEEVQLMASELLSNAVAVARSSVSVCVTLEPESIVIEIGDDGHGPHDLASLGRTLPAIDADAGRGLFIVRALADDISVSSTSDGTVVRCTKSLPRA